MRPFVVTNLARAVGYNLKRGTARAKFFELGHGFELRDGAVVERERLALAAAGPRFPLDWSQPDPPDYDFFDLKGDLEDVLESTVGITARFTDGVRRWLHPGRQAEIEAPDAGWIGFCGEVHPEIAASWGVERRLYVAEIDVAALPESGGDAQVAAWSREPAVERDLALIVPAVDRGEDILAVVMAAGLEYLERARIFDRYSGPQLPEGHYSLGLRLTFVADRTLTDEDVDGEVKRLLDLLREERGYEIR